MRRRDCTADPSENCAARGSGASTAALCSGGGDGQTFARIRQFAATRPKRFDNDSRCGVL